MSKKSNPKSLSQKDIQIQEFLDMIAPSVIKFNTDHFICGNTYRCVWALREYPTATDEQDILRHLGEKDGVTLHLYTRNVTPVEEKKIFSNAANKNRMQSTSTQDLQQTVTAESNLHDIATIVAQMHRSREPLLHVAVYIELTSHDYDQLKLLQTEVLTELIRSKLNVDRLMLRQQQGFQCTMPGYNIFGDQFERVLPASSVANLYPFNYSSKTDPNGFYLGRDKFGSNILADFNRRADDKTNANILILGNSVQGKSYLLKKRVRKKESAVIHASQNLEDFNVEHIRELTKPLFSIPTHQFLFNAGSIDAKFYMDTLQLEKSEFEFIRYSQQGVCLYKCMTVEERRSIENGIWLCSICAHTVDTDPVVYTVELLKRWKKQAESKIS